LEGIIADAVADASGSNGSEEVADGGVVSDGGEVEASSALPDADASADGADADAAAAEGAAAVGAATAEKKDDKHVEGADDKTDVEKILEAAGIKAPKEGERENRIPYHRTVKIIGNALKKAAATHEAALSTVNAKVAAYEGELTNFRRADELATKDPDKYMAILSNINPAFKAYVKGGGAAAADGKPAAGAAAAGADLGPKPGPDIKYADGTTAFSPEQLEKRDEWLIQTAIQKAKTEAEAAAEAKYGPIAKEFATTREGQERHNRIMGVIAAEQQHWGEDFPKPGSAEEKAVNEALKADPKMSLRAAIHKVVVGGLKAGRGKVREEVLTEINGRKGAVSAPPAARKVAADPNTVRSTEDVIRESIAAAGLKG
jgi:hypothetical protein